MGGILGGGGSSSAPTPAITSILSDYSAFAPLFNGIPDIANLLEQASVNNWSSDQFTANLMGTNWWKQTPESGRDWEIRQLTDPATAGQNQSVMGNKIISLGMMAGVPLSHGQVQMLTQAALSQGWSDAMLQQQIVQQAKSTQMRAGSIATTQQQLRGMAADYGVNVADATTFKWAKQVEEGQLDPKAFQTYVSGQAKLSHPYWSKQLDEGVTVRQLADPYIQTASQMLGVSADSVDLSQSKWARALQQKDPKTGQPAPMSQLDWERTLMTDPSYGWDKTDNARQAAFGMVDQLQKSFGAAK